jgi:hypothetical protein
MYHGFTGLRAKTVKKGKPAELEEFPILLPLDHAVFYMDDMGCTRVSVLDQTWMLKETLEEVMELINKNGLKVSNMEAVRVFFPKEEEDYNVQVPK